ncbi:ExbD/TolR family protein [Paracandidimonas soli]|uniref:Biopolymer transport protein ExbD n=1 Tax=Paracandidimonas soli TaxID=1917182 RepID=A0A4R3VDH0_9BURK|nr:biopolymer transporter ExbD [Paracandidimonas soli]TCV01639.1 biopolymer transport protein ExbD [Paracandidimonas soli]
MNFRRTLREDELEINLIPLIDVLLVILIFLAASTSFVRYQQMQLALPQAQAEAAEPQALTLAVSQDNQYALEAQWLSGANVDEMAAELRKAAAGMENPLLVIYADAKATHESVVRAMQAARQAGISRVSFATQGTP